MVLPAVRPATGALFLVVALAAAQLIPLALTAPAAAQGSDVFLVRDVAVDVTADSAAAARDSAIVAGQRKAFDQLLLNLATPEDVAKLPPLGDDAISDMVLDFEVESESVSTVRYIGKLAFRFRAEPVRAYLEQGGASYAVGATRPALILPVLTRDGSSLLWDDTNAWLATWSGGPVGGTLVSIAVPLGDLTDIATIDGPRALDGDAAALQAMAQRYGAGDVVVAEVQAGIDAATGEARLALDAKRYTLTGLAGTLQDNLSAPGGEAALPDLYAQAAQRVSAFLQDEWKRENLVSSTVEQRLDVVAPFASLEEWIDLRRRLGDVSMIRRADLLELARDGARIDLVFVGDQAQLIRALAQRDLALVPVGPEPVPPPAAPAAPPPAAPGTGGSVTVDPTAVPALPPAAGTPHWELRRGAMAPSAGASSLAPAAAPAASVPAVQPAPPAGAQPAPAAPGQPPPAE